ncbi:LAFA_0E15610g1_1 [Lachancea sp. 'fantastica']|nr:LAFA_0E15610g1_1 [Lachancea sp. 'fantastica']
MGMSFILDGINSCLLRSCPNSSYYKEPGDLFSCTSKALLDVVPTVKLSFYWQDGVFKCARLRKGVPRDPVTRAKFPLYTLTIIPLNYSQNARKYLVYVPAHLEKNRPQLHFISIPLIEQPLPSPHQNEEPAAEKLSTILKSIFMVDTFTFDLPSDSKILEKSDRERKYYKEECCKIFQECLIV